MLLVMSHDLTKKNRFWPDPLVPLEKKLRHLKKWHFYTIYEKIREVPLGPFFNFDFCKNSWKKVGFRKINFFSINF